MPDIEYLTVSDVRAEYGDEVADKTDAAIQRQIDQMSAYLEDQIGHTFSRAIIIRSSVAEDVVVATDKVSIDGDDYKFADYSTLLELVDAINDANDTYSAELLANIRGDTPSTLLNTRSSTTCGPDYEDRVILTTSAMYCVISGKCESKIFLPLPLSSIVAITENTLALVATDYWAVTGESWVTKRTCGCSVFSCAHQSGAWSGSYPGNIAVTFVPRWWGSVPGTIAMAMLEAYGARAGLAPFAEEDFGDYSYKRKTAPVPTWQDTLGGSSIRRYSVRFHP